MFIYVHYICFKDCHSRMILKTSTYCLQNTSVPLSFTVQEGSPSRGRKTPDFKPPIPYRHIKHRKFYGSKSKQETRSGGPKAVGRQH